MPRKFVHLRMHSEFSLVDGLVRIHALISFALENNIPVLALTDQSLMCAQIKFYQATHKAGIKPICGVDIWVETDHLESPAKLTLLCMNEQGYRHLMEIVSLSFQKNQHHGKALCKKEWIQKKSEGLIALSGGRDGDIGHALLAEQYENAQLLLQDWKNAFGDRFYLELQRTQRDNEEIYLQEALKLAEKTETPVVATNEVLFMHREDYEAHETRVCIGEGQLLADQQRIKKYSEEQYFKSEKEMIDLFHDVPSAIQNSVEIAKRCNVVIAIGTYHLPKFNVPNNITPEVFLKKISYQGLRERLQLSVDLDDSVCREKYKAYYDRLDFELNTILKMGFAGYFLIVMDFIQWSQQQNIYVGPGRGSGAGSLVAYALKITNIDPLTYDLLFERFLNPERVSMPDFDIDFCMEKRDQVIEYVSRKYGCESVSQIITFGTMAAKAVIRDVARVQGKPYGLADKLSKLIPFEIGMTLAKAYEQEKMIQDFLRQDVSAQEIWEMAIKIEGITRSIGKHAGGVVISPQNLTAFTPLYCDENGNNLITQYDKNDVETVGLIKFDFLGLRTLTIIDWALKMINNKRERENQEALFIDDISLDDRKSYQMLCSGKTTAVFQLESSGMKDLIKRLLPDCFEDIIALIALFRPGPLQSGMVDNFINRKHGKEKIAYPDHCYQHESLQPILISTYGIILYQEQVMKIAQVISGYTLGEADLLRRAMGKKKPEEMAKQRSIFKEGAKKNNIDEEFAMKLFDLVEKFAGYGFNKSHSTAYALLSYQTLWLKTHYPAEFMAAVLSSDMQNTDKVVLFIEESRSLGLKIMPPSVNYSKYMFFVNDEGAIVYGLGALKGLGESTIEEIVQAQEKYGCFKNIFDFCEKINTKKINKRNMEALIKSGALDVLKVDIEDLNKRRAILYDSIEDAIKSADQQTNNQQLGITDLFSQLPLSESDHSNKSDRMVKKWTDIVRLVYEKEILGLYLTGHPMQVYDEEVRNFTRHKISKLQPARQVLITGFIAAISIRRDRKGEKIGFVTLDDGSACLDVAMFADVFSKNYHKLVKDQLISIEGDVSHDDYAGCLKVNTRRVLTIGEIRERFCRCIELKINSKHFHHNKIKELKKIFSAYPGSLRVGIEYQNSQETATLSLDKQHMLDPSEECLFALKDLIGDNKVILHY